MNEQFSIYDSPFSDETKKIRRNVLIASSICIFIGMTNQLPSSFALWGAKFDAKQQAIVGWLLISVTSYLYLHFIAIAGIEIAKWIQPFYEGVITKKRLLKHPAFDETDWIDLLDPADEHSIEEIKRVTESESHLFVQKKLRHLYNLVYLKLFVEVLLPLLVGAFGLIILIRNVL